MNTRFQNFALLKFQNFFLATFAILKNTTSSNFDELFVGLSRHLTENVKLYPNLQNICQIFRNISRNFRNYYCRKFIRLLRSYAAPMTSYAAPATTTFARPATIAVPRRRRMNKLIESLPNVERLFLGSIDADFCK